MAEQSNSAKFVRVVLDRSIRRELDYAVPEPLAEKVVVGSRVRVPFRDKTLLATVVATLAESPAEGIKPLEALLGDKPVLSASLIDELHLAIRPVLLGAGEHLWTGIDMRAVGYECVKSVAGERATHVVLRKRG